MVESNPVVQPPSAEIKDIPTTDASKTTPAEGDPPMSKNKLKRLRKQQEWERKKAELKASGEYKRQRKSKNPAQMAHLRRFNEMSGVDDEGNSRKLSRKEKQKLYKDLCLKGPRVVIDCDFESLMTDREIKSLAQQLAYCVNANKQLEQPMNLIFTGIGDKLHDRLDKSQYHYWGLQTYRNTGYIEAHPVLSVHNEGDVNDETRIDKSKLVYLTADSPNTINQLDEKDVYIIGGIVDRNRYLNLTLKRAEEQGIRHGKLPIGEHVKLQSSTVLTVNHVFQIISSQHNNNGDWKKTLDEVIPQRKVKEEKDDEIEKKVVVLGKRTKAQAQAEEEPKEDESQAAQEESKE